MPGNMDIAVRRDGSTKVVPAAIGDVSSAAYGAVSGWTVVLRHGLGFATQYSHLNNIDQRILQRGLVLTPDDEIGNAGNTGTGAKGWYHLALMLKVPPYAKPNNQFTSSLITGEAATAYTADPARFAEYCVIGKNVGGQTVKLCNFSINYRQRKDFDRTLWEKDKGFRALLGELRKELTMPQGQFRELMRSVLYYDHLLLIERKLKDRFDGKLSPSKADRYLEQVDAFKNFRGPILTAPIKNPYKPELYARASGERERLPEDLLD
jgi:hypothetical protein